MKVIHINESNINDINLSPNVSTIGQFDGLHLGHIKLIKKCLEIKNEKNLKASLITFNPRVDVVIHQDDVNNYLIDQDLFQNKLKELDIDYLLIIDFNRNISKFTHEEFFEKILNKLNIQTLIVGFDFTYGHLGKGNIHTIFDDSLKSLNPVVIDALTIDDIKVGTKEIKQFLSNGDIINCNKFLGYNLILKMELIDKFLYAQNLHLIKDGKYLVKINDNLINVEINNNKLIVENYQFQDKKNIIVEFIK